MKSSKRIFKYFSITSNVISFILVLSLATCSTVEGVVEKDATKLVLVFTWLTTLGYYLIWKKRAIIVNNSLNSMVNSLASCMLDDDLKGNFEVVRVFSDTEGKKETFVIRRKEQNNASSNGDEVG